GVRYMPGQGRYKVYIIDEVHMLSGAAFNALLKTLEEPPPHAVFIFATTEVHKIPLTILSRCQRFDFRHIPFREIQRRLALILEKDGIRFEEGALFTIAREADGSLRDAESLLDQILAFSGGGIKEADVAGTLGLMDRTTLFELAGAVVNKDGAGCLNIVEKIYNFGYDLKRASSEFLGLIRDLMVIKVTGDAGLLEASDSEAERLKELSSSVGEERLHMLFSIISRGYEEVSRSAYPRYVFEMALLKAAHFDEVLPVEELIKRLEKVIRTPNAAKPGDCQSGTREARTGATGLPKGPAAPVKYTADDTDAVDKAEESLPSNVSIEGECGPLPCQSAPAAGIGGLSGYLKEKMVSLSGLLASASIMEDGGTMEITVPADKRPVLEMKKKEIEIASSEYFGRRVTAVIKASFASPEKKTADPVIKEALKILGGKVIEDTRRTNV
ncbi:MAG: DNA polymerase III subunit gamma/tau, partial [Deltaproteobacteria bacterium]|nr:DNA polymerase III subunit gamma/tau [Deltaproteobacteria bacterium]